MKYHIKGLILGIFVFLFGCQVTQQQRESSFFSIQENNPTVLVFSKTAGFRHASIGPGIEMLQDEASSRSWDLDTTEDASVFTDAGLQNYDVVVFLSTTGDILDTSQQEAFERFIQAGGGFVGIHSATDTEYDWPWYEGLVGAYFQNHPPGTQTANIFVADSTHPSTEFLPLPWTFRDEWYNFQTNPAANNEISVLLWLDESSYMGGTMGVQHPIAWYRNYDGGRSWYTAAGHRSELYTDPEHELFRRHIAEGIEWAATNDNSTPLPTPSPTIDPSVTLTPNAFLPTLFR
ncbi:MAG: ThuA domain-containing protein [Chloroflexota bacterium]